MIMVGGTFASVRIDPPPADQELSSKPTSSDPNTSAKPGSSTGSESAKSGNASSASDLLSDGPLGNTSVSSLDSLTTVSASAPSSLRSEFSPNQESSNDEASVDSVCPALSRPGGPRLESSAASFVAGTSTAAADTVGSIADAQESTSGRSPSSDDAYFSPLLARTGMSGSPVGSTSGNPVGSSSKSLSLVTVSASA